MAEKLEAMRAEDFSWHPCKVSLNSTGDGLYVEFESHNFARFMLNKEEVLERLRIRSLPLQGDDCLGVKEGDLVTATPLPGHNACSFDAKVEKVLRVRHYRGPCRCLFTISWIHQDHKDVVNVPSRSVMKLSKELISTNPIVASMLQSENKKESFHIVLCLPGNETANETDLTKRLEQQMEKIGNSIDPSKKEVLEGTPPGSEEMVKRKGFGNFFTSSKVARPCLQKSPEQNQSRRTTRSSINAKIDVEVGITLEPATAAQQGFAENYSRRSPLAACAALASRVQISSSVVKNGASMFGSASINNHRVVGESEKLSSHPIAASPVAVIPVAPEPIKNVSFHISLEKEASFEAKLANFPSLEEQAKWSSVKVGTPECATSTSKEGSLVLGIPSSTFHSRGTNIRQKQQKASALLTPILQESTVTSVTCTDATESFEALRFRGSPERSASYMALLEPVSREHGSKSEVRDGASECTFSSDIEERTLVLGIPISTFYSREANLTNRKRVTRSTTHEQKEFPIEEVEIESAHGAESDFCVVVGPRRKICEVQYQSSVPYGGEDHQMLAARVISGETEDKAAHMCNQSKKKNDKSSVKQLDQFPARRTRSQSKS